MAAGHPWRVLVAIGVMVVMGGALGQPIHMAQAVSVTRGDPGAVLSCGAMLIVPSPNVGAASGLVGVAGTSPRDIIAVGATLPSTTTTISQQMTEHFDGSTWSVLPTPTMPLTGGGLIGLAALSPANYWAVGYTGVQTLTALIESWNGSVWRVVASPTAGFTTSVLEGVAAVTARDIWAVGSAGPTKGTLQPLTEHWNGAAWSVTPSPTVGTDSRLLWCLRCPGHRPGMGRRRDRRGEQHDTDRALGWHAVEHRAQPQSGHAELAQLPCLSPLQRMAGPWDGLIYPAINRWH